MTDEEVRGYYPGTGKPLPTSRGEKPARVEKVDWAAHPIRKFVKNKEVHLYTIGALCAALGRPPVTVRLWIRHGHLPREPFRMPTKNGIKGRRLYSREHIEALVAVAEKHGILGSARVNWEKHPTFANEVRKAWADIQISPT